MEGSAKVLSCAPKLIGWKNYLTQLAEIVSSEQVGSKAVNCDIISLIKSKKAIICQMISTLQEWLTELEKLHTITESALSHHQAISEIENNLLSIL